VSPLSSSLGNIRFGDFDADLQSGELRKRGLRIKLQVQPFQVLQILLERPGEVVTREELQKRIWPADTFVDFDQGLNTAVKKLREALGDDAEKPRFIETLAKRGYRFIGAVQNGAPATETKDSAFTEERVRENHRKRFGWGLVLAVTVLATLVLVFAFNTLGVRAHLLGKASVPRIDSLAVLPLQNLSGDPNQEYFSDGMTDALITDLAQIGSVKVISRTSSTQYKQTKKPLPEIARELNVDGIVEGTVQRSGDRVRITAQLIQGPSDKHLWANSYERDMHDVFGLEREVAADIAHQVQARLTTQNQTLSEEPRPINLPALEAYLQGNYHLEKASLGPRDKELRKAGDYFQQAASADPMFAPAYVGLAASHYGVWWASSDDFEIMRRAAEKAVELAPNSSDAHHQLATARFADWDWEGAEQEYRLAIALNTNNAVAHEHFGDLLDERGELDQGWKEYEIAQELDPNQDHLSWALFRRREHDRAIGLLLRLADNHPEDGGVHWELAQNYEQKGMMKEWLQEEERSMILIGFPEISDRLHRAFAKSGYAGALRQMAEESEYLVATKKLYVPGVFAENYAAVGDKDRAFYWLRDGCEHRHMTDSDPDFLWVKTNPFFTSLRSDQRFNDVLRCMRLPQ